MSVTNLKVFEVIFTLLINHVISLPFIPEQLGTDFLQWLNSAKDVLP